ncbi:MAG: hypothetical protein AAF404_15150 [Pseudomonadota bacterium]
MRVILTAIVIGLLAGCGKAVMVQTPYPWPKYGPSNRSEVGVVSYEMTRRSPAHNDSGRFSAYKLMNNACKGPYEMSGPFEEREPYNSVIQNAEAPVRRTMYIEFWCVPTAESNSYRPLGTMSNRRSAWVISEHNNHTITINRY